MPGNRACSMLDSTIVGSFPEIQGKSWKNPGKNGKNPEIGFSPGKLSDFIELKFYALLILLLSKKNNFLAILIYFRVIHKKISFKCTKFDFENGCQAILGLNDN